MDVTAQYEKQNPVKVCLYTTGTTGFRGWTSHGVSIISFPHVASALAQTFSSNPKDAWADYRRWEIVPGPTKMAVRKRREIVGDEQRTLRRDKEWSRGGRKEQEEYIVPYEILELPGKGMGCVARRLIRKGEVIARGWPALLLHAQLSFIPEREDLIDMAVEELGPNMRERIMKLSGGERGGKIEHVLRSNVFGVEVGGESHIALFPELSVSRNKKETQQGVFKEKLKRKKKITQEELANGRLSTKTEIQPCLPSQVSLFLLCSLAFISTPLSFISFHYTLFFSHKTINRELI